MFLILCYMCIAICQKLSTYMLDFHVCVYIVCICAGGRNVLITQLFILPVCIYIFILCYTCRCHMIMLSTCMFAYHVCVLYVFLLYLSCMYLSWRHGRTASWPSCLSRLKNLKKKKKSPLSHNPGSAAGYRVGFTWR